MDSDVIQGNMRFCEKAISFRVAGTKGYDYHVEVLNCFEKLSQGGHMLKDATNKVKPWIFFLLKFKGVGVLSRDDQFTSLFQKASLTFACSNRLRPKLFQRRQFQHYGVTQRWIGPRKSPYEDKVVLSFCGKIYFSAFLKFKWGGI